MEDGREKTITQGKIKITVEKVEVQGAGAIILVGPSSCGKGEVAKALCHFLSLSSEKNISMGTILRDTVQKAREDKSFREWLAEKQSISHEISIGDEKNNDSELIKKARRYTTELADFYRGKKVISQLDWLEYCVKTGLLVPDKWTKRIINGFLENSEVLQKEIFILDGYPRTPEAAKQLLEIFSALKIPVIRVLFLSITKAQMKLRALFRKRPDDTPEALERRYQFYVEKVQPTLDYFKEVLGANAVKMIDAHQPIYSHAGQVDVSASIQMVVLSVMQALGLPGYLLDL